MRHNIFYFIIFIGISLLLTSCAPQTKEDYMRDYKEFMNDVSNNHKEYSSKDWEKADKDFKKYSDKLKKKFSNELTLLEKGILLGNEVEYSVYKAKQPIIDLLNNYSTDDYESIKKQIKEYKDKDMEDDLEELVKKAEKIGGVTQETVEEILKELDIELDNK